MRDLVTAIVMALGAVLMLLAAAGVLRMPDVFNRMQTATKASTLGVICFMVAAMVHFGTLSVGVRAVLVIVFLLGTAPVGAHVLSRAAHRGGVALWKGSVRDELGRPGQEGRE